MKELNDDFIKIVDALFKNELHDEQGLSEILKISPNEIKEAIKKLKTYGFEIKSTKPLKLSEPMELLDKNKIITHLRHNIDLTILEHIDSTTNYFKGNTKYNSSSACLSEFQSQARGRTNRKWHAPFGKNIYLTFLHPINIDIRKLSGLSLVVSLAVINVLNKYISPKKFLVKWPNDIIYEGKKVCGILIENKLKQDEKNHVLISLGINVNMLNCDNNINQDWTSLGEISNSYIDRNKLCAEIIDSLLIYLDKFKEHGLKYYLDEWSKSDALFETPIKFNFSNEIKYGTAMGINQQGHLILKFPDGSNKAFSSGEVNTIRKT